MKDFLKKVFFADRPAEGAFAGMTLLLVSLWLGPSLYLLCGGMAARNWTQLFRGNWPLIFLLLPLPMFLYWLAMFVRFQRAEIVRSQPKWNSPGTLFAIALLIPTLAAAPTVSEKYGFGYGFCLLLVIPVWIIPAVSLPRQWKFWLPRALCWTGAFCCLIHFLKSLMWTWNYMSFFGFSTHLFRNGIYDSPTADLLIVYLTVILFVTGYLLSAKMYAAAAGVQDRKISGPAVKISLGIAVAVYLISGVMAFVQHHVTERTAAETGAYFGYPLNADGLNALLRKNGWGRTARPNLPNRYMNHPYLCMNSVILPEEVRRGWQAELERLEPLKRWEREMDQPFRSGFAPAKDGNLTMSLAVPMDYRWFCGFERWKIVFLLKNDKPAEALDALHRMETALESCRRNPACLYELIWCEGTARLDAMELLLSDGRVPDSELKRWADDLKRREKEVPELERQSIYAQAVFLNDMFYRFAHGDSSLPLYPLRWLYPPVWYYEARDRERVLSRYRHDRWRDFPAEKQTVPGIIGGYYYPPVFFWTHLTKTLTARYRAMRALIGAELEKRRTEKYPDKLENPPADPFTGKPMLYKKGKLPLIVRVWNPALGRLVSERREADGISVWSVGRNGKSEQGQDQATVRQYADDVRAKIVFGKTD